MTNEQRAIEALRELIMLGGLFDKVRAGHGATYTTVEPVLELMAHPDTIYRRLPAAMSEARSALAAVDAEPKRQAVAKVVHDGDSLPMIDLMGRLYRLQELDCGWQTVADEAIYQRILAPTKDPSPAQPAEPVQEPVAYGYWNKHLGWYGLSLQPGGSYTEPDRRPLYAAPPAPQRQPLTESRIVACLVEAGCLGTVRMSYDSGPYEITRTSINADKFARAVERAHGIGGDK